MEQSAATEGDGLDLSGLGKAELVDLFHRLLAEKPIQTLRRDAEAIKVAFYKIHRAETEAARRAFLDAGGDPETFVPEPDEQEQRLKEQIGEYRRLRDEFIAGLKKLDKFEVDICLPSHTNQVGILPLVPQIRDDFNPFIDPSIWHELMNERLQRVYALIEKEKAN